MKTSNFKIGAVHFSAPGLLLIGGIFFHPITSFSGKFLGDVEPEIAQACYSADGVPLGGELAATCCGADTTRAADTPECRASFASGLADSFTTGFQQLQIANGLMNVANDMNGLGVNNGPDTPGGPADTANSGASGGRPSRSAMVSGGQGSLPGLPGSGAVSPFGNLNAAGSGAGAGGGGNSGGGSGGAGSGASESANTKKDSDSKTGDAAGAKSDGLGGFVAGEGGAKDGSGAGGDGKVNTDGFGDARFGSGAGAGAGQDAMAEFAGDGMGSPVDPSDYFRRIDPSANIFKIVSKRYTQKKSLWPLEREPGAIQGIVPVIERARPSRR